MDTKAINIDSSDIQKLLGAANPDAALLYLFMRAGNMSGMAVEQLHFSEKRLASAGAVLRQLGLWGEDDKKTHVMQGPVPVYSENDVLDAMGKDGSFCSITEEVQNLLGRALNIEEMKILLGFVRYLGLPADVVITLVYYCRDRARNRGAGRNPSLRSIEREAYRWAENGIDSLEEAAAYIQSQHNLSNRIRGLMEVLQIRGRNLTQAEERYACKWIDAGFDKSAIELAYEKSCLNTGGLRWGYMDSILTRWKEQGFLTAEAVKAGDRKPQRNNSGNRSLDDDERKAIEDLFSGGNT